MKTLDEVLLDFAKEYIKNLSNEEYLGLAYNSKHLHDKLIEFVYGQSSLRFKNPTRVTADIFGLAKSSIKDFMRKLRKCEKG